MSSILFEIDIHYSNQANYLHYECLKYGFQVIPYNVVTLAAIVCFMSMKLYQRWKSFNIYMVLLAILIDAHIALWSYPSHKKNLFENSVFVICHCFAAYGCRCKVGSFIGLNKASI